MLTFRAVNLALASHVYVARKMYGDEDVLARPHGRWELLVDDQTYQRIRDHVQRHQRLPRQATQRYLLTGLLRCPRCGMRMTGSSRTGHGPRYRCNATDYGANSTAGECRYTALAAAVDGTVLSTVLPVISAAVSDLPDLQAALSRAWDELRSPVSLQDSLAAKQRSLLQREAEQARTRLTKAAVLFADGEIDKAGYELLRDKARADLDATTLVLDQVQMAEPRVVLPPLETVLAAAEGWESALQGSDIAAQREVLATLIERVEPLRIGRGKYAVEIIWSPLGDGLQAAVVGQAYPERSTA